MFENHMFLLASGTAQSGGQASSVPMLTTFALMILVMYIFLIRPQSKKQKAIKQMLSNIKNGDKIVTIGGIYGTIITVKDSTVILKVDSNTELEIVRESISNVISHAESKTQDSDTDQKKNDLKKK